VSGCAGCSMWCVCLSSLVQLHSDPRRRVLSYFIRRTFFCLQGHLDEARELQPKVPAAARPLLLPAVATGLYLDALQRVDFDPFAPALRRGGFSPLWHQLVVKWRLLRGTY